MAQPLTGGLGPDIVLAPSYIVRVTALDATTGAVVAGVVVSDVALQVNAAEPDTEPANAPAVVPPFVYATPT